MNNFEFSVFSNYNSPSSALNSELFYKIESSCLNYLVCGDFNSKSTLLGCKSNNNNGDILVDITINSNGQLLNDNLDPTFNIINRNYSELLDRMFGSTEFAAKMSEYEVLKESVLDSDHLPIKTTFGFEKRTASKSSNKSNSIFNFNKADWTNLSKDLNCIKYDDCAGSNMSEVARIFIDKIVQSVNVNIPKIKNIGGFDSSSTSYY